MFDLRKRPALAVAALLSMGGAACGGGSSGGGGEQPPPAPPAGNELLTGGDFSDPSLWHLLGLGDATATPANCSSYTGQCLRVKASDYGPSPYSTELVPWDASASSAKFLPVTCRTYVMSVRASADRAGTAMRLVLQDSNYQILGAKDIQPKTVPQTYVTDPFTLTGDGDATVKVFLGGEANNGATFSIDDVRLLDQGGDDQCIPRPAGMNLLAGGDFEGTFDPTVWSVTGPGTESVSTGACYAYPGKCLLVSSSDWGAADDDTQLVFSQGSAPALLTLSAANTYRLWLHAASSVAGKTITARLQDAQGNVIEELPMSLITPRRTFDSGEFTVPADVAASFRVSFGTQAANGGATFSLDDLGLFEVTEGPTIPNMLTDGDFETSTSGIWATWSNDGGNAAFQVADCSADGFSGMCMKVTGSAFGSNPWSTQLVQWDNSTTDAKMFTIEAGKTYTVKFRARASAAGTTLQAVMQGSKATYSPTYQQSQDLTTTATNYTLNFTGMAAGQLGFKMQFQSTAGSPVTIEVDDIQLYPQP